MALTVSRSRIHLPHVPAERLPGIEYSTDPAPRELVDAEIESEEYREQNLDAKLKEGILCITVAPGDALGEVAVNVQFEGAVGQWDECVGRQGAVLADSLAWLRDFFSQLGDFDASISASPCPKADPVVRIAAIDTVVEQQIRQDRKRTNDISADVTPSVEYEAEEQRQLDVDDA